MAGFPIPFVKSQWLDANGNPVAGGKLYSFAGGTSTPLATYTSQALTTPNANPVILDANGRADVFVPDNTLYKFRLDTSADVTLWTVDNVAVPSTTAAAPPIVVPTGAILAFGALAAPTGYLVCDGSAISRSTFAALFAVIGTVFGAGDGSTTFNIPDLRQKFPLGKAASGTGVNLGSAGGAIDHTHTGPSHTHGVGTLATSATGTTEATQTGAGATKVTDAHTHAVTGATAADGTGATGTANPPFLSVQYIIRTGN